MDEMRILLVDDDDVFRTVMQRELSRRGYDVRAAADGAEALDLAPRQPFDVVLLDLRLPDMDGLAVLAGLRERGVPAEVIMLTGHGTIETAIEATRLGAFDYISKPCPMSELELRLRKVRERRDLADRNRLLEGALIPPDRSAQFVGASPWHRDLQRDIARFGATDVAVLILGETGTGKEVVARMLHGASPRRSRPFVVVDCASLGESLLRSELFGHERGAFTGATGTKHGLFEVANQGTLFLDELGDTSPEIQVKLLRVLETSRFRRLGGTRELSVDVRIVAATNRDVRGLMQQGLFREDLYYRLSTVCLSLAPLRERPEDIRAIAAHHIGLHNVRFGRKLALSPAAEAALLRHPWPGNVRELLHALEQAMIVADGPLIQPQTLPALVREPAPAAAAAAVDEADLPTLAELEARHVELVLRRVEGHRQRAAQILGISERNLYRKLRELGLG